MQLARVDSSSSMGRLHSAAVQPDAYDDQLAELIQRSRSFDPHAHVLQSSCARAPAAPVLSPALDASLSPSGGGACALSATISIARMDSSGAPHLPSTPSTNDAESGDVDHASSSGASDHHGASLAERFTDVCIEPYAILRTQQQRADCAAHARAMAPIAAQRLAQYKAQQRRSRDVWHSCSSRP